VTPSVAAPGDNNLSKRSKNRPLDAIDGLKWQTLLRLHSGLITRSLRHNRTSIHVRLAEQRC